jgi:hypothetical protein
MLSSVAFDRGVGKYIPATSYLFSKISLVATFSIEFFLGNF